MTVPSLPIARFPVSTAHPDAELVSRLQSGEAAAFDRLVALYGDRIFGFGMKMCGEREDARDVVQETFLQAFRKVGKLEQPGALLSWLFRIASNACLMKRRKGKFEPDRELSLEELAPKGPDSARVEIPDASALPEDEAARAELRGLVRQAILDLPSHYRVVLVLRDMEQMSTRQTAKMLDLQETAVKMRLHRARLMVRRQLEESLTGQGTEEARA
jgi:RNA polymerase sigma-70 factor (ECF subfamily)